MDQALPPNAPRPLLRPFLHPSERSRLALALAAVVVFVVIVIWLFIAANQGQVLGELIGVLIVLPFFIWVSVQIVRAKQLGRACA